MIHRTTTVLVCSLVITLLVGCVAPQPRPLARKATFNETEYAAYDQPGNCTVTGQAFLKTRGGDVKFGAGNEVYLNPVTSYSSEWYQVTVLQGKPLIQPDSRAEKYHHKTVADGNGRFKFSNLAPGEYYIACPIFWEIPSQYGPQRTGGIAHTRVNVTAEGPVDVIVTR